MRKPFYKKQTKRWYVHHNGKQVPLGQDETEAFRKWQQMVDMEQETTDPSIRVLALVNHFLNDIEGTVSTSRFNQYANYLARFARKFGPRACCTLRRNEILKWIDSVPTWGPYGRKDAIDSITRLFNWAINEQQLKLSNPLKGAKKPRTKPRDRTITDEEHRALIQASLESKINGKEFALYLIASRCGARPQDIRSVRACDVHHGGSVWKLEEHKTAHITGPKTVYLTPCLATLTRILVAKYKKGHLFRQYNGQPWRNDIASKRFRRLRDKLKMDKNLTLYCYRHAFATQALLRGVPIADVAALLGHTDLRMVSRIYGHLDQHTDHLLKRASEASQRG